MKIFFVLIRENLLKSNGDENIATHGRPIAESFDVDCDNSFIKLFDHLLVLF